MILNQHNIKSDIKLDASLDFIFETVELGVLIENPSRTIEFANTLFCKLFQISLTPQELKSSSFLNNASVFSLNFEDAAKFEKSIIEIPKSQIIVRNEKWKLIDGKTILRDYIPIFSGNHLTGHIWLYREHKPTPKIQTTENFSAIIEKALNQLPSEIAIFNTHQQFIYANKAYVNSNEKRLWAIGKTLVQYFSYANLPVQTALYRLENINNCINQKKAISWEELNISLAKNKQYYLRTCYPVFNDDGQLESVIEQSIDISQQRKLEFELTAATEYFFSTLDRVNDIVLQTDGELKLQFINKAWENISGQRLEAYQGKSIFDVLSITRYELYRKIFAILSGEAKEKTGLLLLKGKDGKEKQLQYNLQSSFNVDTTKQGIVATLTDITEQQLQEKQLLELVKREKELNELKTAFVNMVSHELRTPLTVISSSAEILDLMLMAGKGHDEVSIYTKQIIDEVEKMTAFMQDLLMVSKIEAGKIEMNPKEMDVVNFLAKIINNGCNPWKDGRKAKLIVKRNSKNVTIDDSMLQHAIQNLLQNAFKYSSGKTDVKVRVAFSNSYYTIAVIDDGIGIPANEIEKLFTSFFRATNTGNISGTGIGLIVAKYFTEQHKGYISVKSRINKGSIFTIKLPYKQ
jgi:PAS domain S-box-containing protein